MTLFESLEGLVSFEGRLEKVEQEKVLIRLGKERILWVPLALIKTARLVVEI
jgi:ribosome maturation factor RimP